jgi:hypothetical protein
LDLALCYGYGIGITKNWSKCLSWVEKAVSLGSEAALIFLKRLSPDLTTISVAHGCSEHLVSVWDAVTRYHDQRCAEGHIAEANHIVNLLRDTEPELYQHQHNAIVGCFCKPLGLTIDSSDSVLAFAAILHQLWTHFSYSPNESLPDEIDLAGKVHMVNSEGYTLLHAIAQCQHPPFKEGEVDIVRCIGDLLINLGCPLNSQDSRGHTPLEVAILAKNLSIIELLVNKGIKACRILIRFMAMHHESQILEKILPTLDTARTQTRNF